MAKTGGAGRRWGGILAAYLLVVQAALTSLAIGATPVTADPFTVICNTAAADSGEAPAKGHSGLPTCCASFCAMHAGGMAPPPSLATALPPPRLAAVSIAVQWADGPAAAAERTSQNSRAPPARV